MAGEREERGENVIGSAKKTRREFLKEAVLAGTAASLLGAGASAGPAEAQTATPAAPAALEKAQAGWDGFEYGVSMNPYEAGGETGIARLLDLAQEAGANSVSVGIHWPTVQPSGPNDANLGPIDALRRLAAERGVLIHFNVVGTPDWVHPNLASRVPSFSDRQWYPPQTDAERRLFGEFVGKLAQRYGSNGVSRYAIWVEPNNPHYSFRPFGYPDAAAPYAALLRAGYLGVKEGAPGAKVSFGGLSLIDQTYMRRFYEEVKKFPDAAANKLFFDEMDVHPYCTGGSPEAHRHAWRDARAAGPRGVHKLKNLMNASGDDPAKNMFFGEIGWVTSAGTWFDPIGDPQRALFLKETFARTREIPYVSGLSWYTFHNHSAAQSPGWAILQGAELSPTKTFKAYREATGLRNVAKVYPAPPAGGVVSGTWTVKPVWGTFGEKPAAADVVVYELYVDGVRRRQSGAAPLAFDTRTVPNGRHEIVLAAYAKNGSVHSAKPIVVEVKNNTYFPGVVQLSPAPGSATADRTPPIQALVRDGGTELTKANIRMLLNGKAVPFSYNQATDRLTYAPPALPVHEHTVRVEATNKEGRTRDVSWSFFVR